MTKNFLVTWSSHEGIEYVIGLFTDKELAFKASEVFLKRTRMNEFGINIAEFEVNKNYYMNATKDDLGYVHMTDDVCLRCGNEKRLKNLDIGERCYNGT